MKKSTEAVRNINPSCPFCWGSGVVFALEDGSLIRAGETVINQNPKWSACPECSRSSAGDPFPILRDVDAEGHRDPDCRSPRVDRRHEKARVIL